MYRTRNSSLGILPVLLRAEFQPLRSCQVLVTTIMKLLNVRSWNSCYNSLPIRIVHPPLSTPPLNASQSTRRSGSSRPLCPKERPLPLYYAAYPLLLHAPPFSPDTTRPLPHNPQTTPKTLCTRRHRTSAPLQLHHAVSTDSRPYPPPQPIKTIHLVLAMLF